MPWPPYVNPNAPPITACHADCRDIHSAPPPYSLISCSSQRCEGIRINKIKKTLPDCTDPHGRSTYLLIVCLVLKDRDEGLRGVLRQPVVDGGHHVMALLERDEGIPRLR